MPRLAKPLTVTAINHAISKAQGNSKAGRDFPLWDGNGLHLIDRNGRYHWRLKYVRADGRENRLAIGSFPAVSLKDARTRAASARQLLSKGIDPAAKRKADKAEHKRKITATFQHFGEAWLTLKSPGWAEQTRRKQWLVVHSYLIPALGTRDVREITTAEVLKVLRKMNTRTPTLARKAARAAQAIIRQAITEGAREDGRVLDLNLRDNLPSQHKSHYAAATTRDDVLTVMSVIRGIRHEVTRAALLVCTYTAQRPGDVAAMRWQDVDPKTAEWLIPKTKTGQPHVVPLSQQALEQIESMRSFTGGEGYVFPPLARQDTPHLNRDTLSKALRDAGLRGKQTPHGLRATLRTVARERLGVSADVLEAQLAHAKRGDVQQAYDRTGFIAERHRVMQGWADYLDNLRAGGTVTPIKRKESGASR